MAIANVPITSLPEATAPSANDYLILQGTNTQKIKWSALLNKLYPVGCIYQSTSSTSPASFLGGTWERIKDKFILAAGDTYAAGTSGGETTHTLTIDEMPSHNHSLYTYQDSTQEEKANFIAQDNYTFKDGYTYRTTGVRIMTTVGGSRPHNNMPPYTAMYAWKRIS